MTRPPGTLPRARSRARRGLRPPAPFVTSRVPPAGLGLTLNPKPARRPARVSTRPRRSPRRRQPPRRFPALPEILFPRPRTRRHRRALTTPPSCPALPSRSQGFTLRPQRRATRGEAHGASHPRRQTYRLPRVHGGRFQIRVDAVGGCGAREPPRGGRPGGRGRGAGHTRGGIPVRERRRQAPATIPVRRVGGRRSGGSGHSWHGWRARRRDAAGGDGRGRDDAAAVLRRRRGGGARDGPEARAGPGGPGGAQAIANTAGVGAEEDS